MKGILETLNENIWLPIKAIFSANHDYPYHDQASIINPDEENKLLYHYHVGQNNLSANGDQSKTFVSKRMIITHYSTTHWTQGISVTIRLNHSQNTIVYLSPKIIDAVNDIYIWEKEIRTNVTDVYIVIPEEESIMIYCEGVLPQETRDAE